MSPRRRTRWVVRRAQGRWRVTHDSRAGFVAWFDSHEAALSFVLVAVDADNAARRANPWAWLFGWPTLPRRPLDPRAYALVR